MALWTVGSEGVAGPSVTVGERGRSVDGWVEGSKEAHGGGSEDGERGLLGCEELSLCARTGAASLCPWGRRSSLLNASLSISASLWPVWASLVPLCASLRHFDARHSSCRAGASCTSEHSERMGSIWKCGVER